MDQHYKAEWRQAEADLTALCQSNSAQLGPSAAPRSQVAGDQFRTS